jgi:hypothetical protein
MTWTIYFKGITGHQSSVDVDETAVNAGGLETAIISKETGGNSSTTFDGADALTYADCYGTMFVQRNGEWITDLTTENGKGFLNATLVQDGDTIICTVWDTGNKRERQQIKLGVAQIKRKALMSATPTSEVYYRSNNTFETDDLPTVYNTDNETLTDNPNPGGLLEGRPWATSAVTALFTSLGAEFEIIVDDTTGISPGMIMTGMDYGGATVTVVTVNSSTSLEMSIIAPDTVPSAGTVLTFTNP